jgi:hypothetical protein
MTNAGYVGRFSSQNHLRTILSTEFDDVHQAYGLLDEFLQHESYNHDFCLSLLTLAKHRTGVPWDIRRLAILILEHQILKLHPDNLSEFDFLLTQLGLIEAPGTNTRIVSSVLKEGYSTNDFRPFISELCRKLARLNRVHDKIRGRRTPDLDLRDFIGLSRRDCKLSLARYLFTPDEVVDEILGHVRVTGGAKDLDISEPAFVEEELTLAMADLPEFEARILKRLCETSNIYWVSEATSSEINSLVEYPAATVVLVVKPPGSDIEFEIKRAGRKGHKPLNIIYARNGYPVPPSHRLDGGSMQWLLRYEARSASHLGATYRLAHGIKAPIATYSSRSTIYAVPVREAQVQTVAYFTESRSWDRGFAEMRVAMKEAVSAFNAEGYARLPDLPGDLGLTAQFLSIVAPAQAILTGTTSFRLDKVASYLSGDGAQRYFQEGMAVAYSSPDARRLADAMLEEILGVFRPPDVRYETYEQYLAAAFGVTENRTRADRFYLAALQQIAWFWGTLFATRAYSRGESFVARNVGLKSLWNDGEWRVNIIFMDHDAVVTPGAQNRGVSLEEALPGVALDESFIWGNSSHEEFSASEVGCLQKIYRVNNDVCNKGQALVEIALKKAYKETQHRLFTSLKLKSLFDKTFLERLRDLDVLVEGYLRIEPNSIASRRWKEKMGRQLAAKGHTAHSVAMHMRTIENNRAFLERYAFLFDVSSKMAS